MNFCTTFLTIKFNKIFLLKLSYEDSYAKFDAFEGEIVRFNSSKARRWEGKVLKLSNI